MVHVMRFTKISATIVHNVPFHAQKKSHILQFLSKILHQNRGRLNYHFSPPARNVL